ncbi:glycoside hydrolase family 26 protein [Nonomuraea sp. NPDC059194]|uniref:glycoside hydrolase family 26 protein n=1 Tax=Nonomuraea sp. NPDC059194 TaxID=3346764 RepID=UPI003696857F
MRLGRSTLTAMLGLTAAACLTLAFVQAQEPDQGQPSPVCSVDEILVPSCGAWWGVYSIKGKTLTTSVTDIEQRVGRRFDIVLRYHDFSGKPGPGVFPDASEIELGASRMLFFAWESRLYGDDVNLTWPDLAAGAHDEVIRQAATRIREYGKRVFVSLDPEMDRLSDHGPKKGTPADYVAAARRVHRLFEEAGVTNAVWVWTVTGYLGGANGERMKAMYPGDEYVDWVAYDPYNFYACQQAPWETFEESIAKPYHWLEREGFGDKPFMLPEYGTQFDPADPGRAQQWYRDIPAVLKEKFPNIKGMIRWNSDFNCGLGLDNGPGMLDAFAEAGRDPYLNPGVATD